MNCPKCSYPNPQGATHCGMCYEVFNRSAAESYLRQARRERMKREREEGYTPPQDDTQSTPPPPVVIKESIETIREKLPPVDWSGLARQIKDSVKRHARAVLWTSGILIGLIAVNTLRSPAIWFGIFGCPLRYAFTGPQPSRYLSSYTTELNSWSERQGSQSVDTPLQEFRLDEFGNLTLEKSLLHDKKLWVVTAQPVEWLLIRRDRGEVSAKSQMLSLRHGSLTGGRIFFDRDGTIRRRDYPANARMGRSLNFAVPTLPSKRLREGYSWTETFTWVESMGDWKIRWAGKVTWTLQNFVSEGSDKSVLADGRGVLRPQILDGPSWAVRGLKQATFKGPPVRLSLVFDRRRRSVIANTATYSGTIAIPIPDLSLIPLSMRIGRRVRGPGRIVLDFKNRIDLRQN